MPVVDLNKPTGSGLGDLLASNNLSDVNSTSSARTNLGLGNVNNTSDATKNSAVADLTNKRIVPRVSTTASTATLTPAHDKDVMEVTAQAAGLTIANPTGTYSDKQSFLIIITDDGTARAISFGANYRAIGVTLPTTTTISKTMYLGVVYNSAASKFDVLSVQEQA